MPKGSYDGGCSFHLSAPKGRGEFAAAFGETRREGRSINWKPRRRRPRKSPFFGGFCAHASIIVLIMGESRRQTPIDFEPTRGTFRNGISIFFYCASSVASKNALTESISLPILFGCSGMHVRRRFFMNRTICRQVLKQYIRWRKTKQPPARYNMQDKKQKRKRRETQRGVASKNYTYISPMRQKKNHKKNKKKCVDSLPS